MLKPASVFELPPPFQPEVRDVIAYTCLEWHRCGLDGGHVYRCSNPWTCTRPKRSPCEECTAELLATYRAGRVDAEIAR